MYITSRIADAKLVANLSWLDSVKKTSHTLIQLRQLRGETVDVEMVPEDSKYMPRDIPYRGRSRTLANLIVWESSKSGMRLATLDHAGI